MNDLSLVLVYSVGKSEVIAKVPVLLGRVYVLSADILSKLKYPSIAVWPLFENLYESVPLFPLK